MPEKSGIALLKELKSDEQLKKIPVIMVTGVSGETGINLESFFRNRPQEDGKDAVPRPEGFLEKPVDPERLLALIEQVLS
jgi:two-component system phosphate regulon response regulator PhoB